MQGLEKITARIMDEARAQVNANLEQAKQEAAQILEQSRTQAAQKRAVILDKANNTAAETEKRMLSLAELDYRKQILQAKQDLVEETFRLALEKLIALPDQQYMEIMAAMIYESVKEGTGEIILSPSDKGRLNIIGLLESVNKRLLQEGKTGNVRLSGEERNFSGGFILKRGDIEINNTFEVLLKVNREELEHDVLSTLFG